MYAYLNAAKQTMYLCLCKHKYIVCFARGSSFKYEIWPVIQRNPKEACFKEHLNSLTLSMQTCNFYLLCTLSILLIWTCECSSVHIM